MEFRAPCVFSFGRMAFASWRRKTYSSVSRGCYESSHSPLNDIIPSGSTEAGGFFPERPAANSWLPVGLHF